MVAYNYTPEIQYSQLTGAGVFTYIQKPDSYKIKLDEDDEEMCAALKKHINKHGKSHWLREMGLFDLKLANGSYGVNFEFIQFNFDNNIARAVFHIVAINKLD